MSVMLVFIFVQKFIFFCYFVTPEFNKTSSLSFVMFDDEIYMRIPFTNMACETYFYIVCC